MNTRLLSTNSISGTDVINLKGDKLGDIKDLMIDPQTGRVNYVVMSRGGILGIGDKYFAIPLEAFNVDRQDEKFVLDVPESKFENAPGFDKDNWPTSANDEFTNRVYNHYGYEWRTAEMATL